MSDLNGYDVEMNAFPGNEQVDRILLGEGVDDARVAELARAVSAIRALGNEPIAEDVARRHVAMASVEASLSLDAQGAQASLREHQALPRRRFAVTNALHSATARTFVLAVTIAILGTGVAVAANGSAPGDTLHGLDRAMERVGIANGGAHERLQEAQDLASVNLPGAVAAAANAVSTAGNEEAADALEAAAERIGGIPADELPASMPEDVQELLDLIRTQLEAEGHGVIGSDVAAKAQTIGNKPSGTPSGPPIGLPVEPPVTSVSTPPSGTTPVGPPVSTPTIIGPPATP